MRCFTENFGYNIDVYLTSLNPFVSQTFEWSLFLKLRLLGITTILTPLEALRSTGHEFSVKLMKMQMLLNCQPLSYPTLLTAKSTP